MKTDKTESLELAAPAGAKITIASDDAPQDPVAQMLAAVVEKGVTSENVGALEKLCDLYEKMQSRNAEKQFAAAFVALQAEMPRITADKSVPDKYGNLKYRFAPYEDIMGAVRPLLLKHGFTVTFSMTYSDGRVIQNCTLQHTGGHSRTNQFAARIGSGPPGSSDAQADGAASTYAKRFAFCNALNITIESDNDGAQTNDARAEGEPISKDKIQYLREQVKETGSDEARFLATAGVKTYDEITEGSYSVLVRMLAAKVKK